MANIKSNGGAASVWRSPHTGLRIILCHNGKILCGMGGGSYHHTLAEGLRRLVGLPLTEQEAALTTAGCVRDTLESGY